MKNVEVIYTVLKRHVKEVVVETKSVREEYPSIEHGSQHTTNSFTISEHSRDILFPNLDCGLDPRAYSCFYAIIRGIE